jgi:hypothetical protein
MDRDWPHIIKEQADIAGIKGKVVKAILADPGAPMQTIARLSRDVEDLARQFDALFLEMSDELGLEDPLIDEALAAERMWSNMSVDLSDRLKASKHLRLVSSDGEVR